MQSCIADRLHMADLVAGWIHRDLGEWDSLRNLFHPNGTIEITWFEGKFTDFVDASMRMGASALRTKHVIASPIVKFDRNRAIAETNAIIVCENVLLDIGCSAHSRFYDLIEKSATTCEDRKAPLPLRHGHVHFPTRGCRTRHCYPSTVPARIRTTRLRSGKEWLPRYSCICNQGKRPGESHQNVRSGVVSVPMNRD